MIEDLQKQNSPAQIWREYQKGIEYKNLCDVYETVKRNENFYLGRQWEGLNAPDLEKPVLNFLKRVITYFISMLVSDDIGIELRFFGGEEDKEALADLLAKEVERVIERTRAKTLNRDALRNAAVDGDCCFFLRFDPDIKTGQTAKGEIAIELIDNTNIIFGNPHVSEVQDQPYLILVKRIKLATLKAELKAEGFKDWQSLKPDYEGEYYGEERNLDEDMVTVLYKLWKDSVSRKVSYIKTTQNKLLKGPVSLGYSLYPVAWMNWDKVKNSYHGQGAITQGAIQNQIYVNTLWALFMIHQKKMAFPKTFYDITKIDKWTNKVGQAIGVIGNPNEAIAGGFRAPDFSNQAMALVEKTIAYTKDFMGASDAALGTMKADNASAIIALQKASGAPLELQRISFYQFLEDYVRIIIEMMKAHYGIRRINSIDHEGKALSGLVDFSRLDYNAMELNVEVGSAAYWSELMQVQTLDNLFNKNIISDAVTYLESIPDRYIKNKRRLIKDLRTKGQSRALGARQA